jgi:prepilin-type N-terminal cleavage/methylation domain-containing protein/prepilin-type processing-associated H-X9-DG protein
MAASSPNRRRPGLSLIELLLVLGISAIVLSLGLAAVPMMRQSANRTHCAANLHQLGMAIQMYQLNNDGRFPVAARLPSVTPEQPSIAQVLEKYTEGTHLFRCPSDTKYYPTEGLSYEYPGEFRGGVTLEQLRAQGRSSARVWVLHDFDPVHGRRFARGARNFLYADGHVSP